MSALFFVLDTALRFYLWAVIASVVLSWLVVYNVIDTRNRFVFAVGDFLHRITDPVLRRIRNVVPNLGSFDISPLILIVAIAAARLLLRDIFY
jgi:YggT family protein